MQNKKLLIPIFIILSMALAPLGMSASMSDLQPTPLMPIEWQAIKLQESIEGKITRSLNPIIKESDYVIEVKIGVDLEKMEDPSSKKITKNTLTKKVRFSTADIPKEGDDFVLFNKLGLEAPIVGEEPVETETSEVELAQKAMIEMNDRFNLFNFLNAIDIKLTFDKELTAKTRENISKVISGLSFNTKEVVPQINIQYLELRASRVLAADSKSPLAPKAETKSKIENAAPPKVTWDDRFKNLDIMIGIIIGALLLAAVALIIAKSGSKHEEVQEAKTENQDTVDQESVNENENENEIDGSAIIDSEDGLNEDGEDVMTLDLTKTDPQTLRINMGLERFRKIFTFHYNDMILLLKGWIKVGRGSEALALKGLVATLTDPELADIFKALTIDERNTWKMCLDSEMNKEELAKAFTFVSNKIMEAMMVPSLIDDYEICDLLLALTPEDAAKFSMEYRELGAIFANVLSSKTIGEMFTLMPMDVTTDIIERSSMFRKEEVLAQMPLLKEKMLEVKYKRERPPFLARILDILPNAKPELESKLYSTLIQHCAWDDVQQTALKFLPREVLSNVSDSIFKGVIGAMSLDAQVQFFASRSDEERLESIDRFASKGSKTREMIDVEINMITKNEVSLRRLQNEKKKSIDDDFIMLTREYIEQHPEAQSEMKSEVEIWLQNIKAQYVTSGKRLKSA